MPCKHNNHCPIKLGAGFEQPEEIIAIELRKTDIKKNEVRNGILSFLKGAQRFVPIFVTDAGDANATQAYFYNFTYNC
jgi:hypothetical protein